MPDNEYEYEPEELKPPRPYTPEQRAELDALYAQMAADLEMING